MNRRGSDTVAKAEDGTTQAADRDVGFDLAENIARIGYDDLPAQVVDVTKKTLLDTLGVIVGGSGAGAGVAEIVDLVRDGGGKPESTVIGHGLRTNAWMAAFANGAMAHALDYDNVHDDAFTHPSTATVPAALAAAERSGGVSGRQFIAALALADDLHCRLAYSVARIGDMSRQGAWMPPVALGGFAAAAAAAKLLGLDAARTLDALGLVYNRTGGSIEIVETPYPSYLRGLYAAFPSITGVLSAVMAARGIPGIKTCFEGKAGLYNVYFRGLYDRASLVQELGQRFEGAGVSFKPWPSCRFSNPYIDATLQLVRAHDLRPADVEQVIVSYAVDKARNCIEPLDVRRSPKSPPEAKLSIPFTVALAIARRKVEIVDFDEDSLRSPEVLGLAQKVVGKYDAQMVSKSKTMLPAVVEIRTRSGQSHLQRVDLVYGHPDKPMSWDDLGSKFRDCARFAARRIAPADVERVVERVRNLETVADLREVIGLVA